MTTAERRTSLLAGGILLATAASWGSTFFLIHGLLHRIPVLDFLSVRFIIAAAAMLLLAPRAIGRLSPEKRRRAILLGLLYGGAQILQTAGLARTPASVSGFITGMYVVATPLFAALLLHTRIGRATWGAVALAVAGLGVLTLSGFHAGYGEALTLVAAMIYALHIVGLGRWSRPSEAVGMAVLQMVVIAVVCTLAALPQGITLPHRTADWLSVLYMALIAGAAALLGQTWAQAHLPPTRSAIIMSMEPVFAAFFAVIFGGEQLSWRMLVGGGLVVAAMLVVELMPRPQPEADRVQLPH